MPDNPAFELFEGLCQELLLRTPNVIPCDKIDPDVMTAVRSHYGMSSNAAVYNRAISDVAQHFAAKGSKMPFAYDPTRGEFSLVDREYAEYVVFASNHRGVGGIDSKDFEVKTARRVACRVTGMVQRVGAPRDKLKRKSEIVKHLETLGFARNCLEARDKDGGLDLLWMPPLGAVPLRPVISLQCKNSSFNEKEASSSAARAIRTLNRHSHMCSHKILYVVFNDYIDDRYVGRAAGWIFVPLGLTDLGAPLVAIDECIL